jgi:hypothetical protein
MLNFYDSNNLILNSTCNRQPLIKLDKILNSTTFYNFSILNSKEKIISLNKEDFPVDFSVNSPYENFRLSPL